jgi:hypothetical protein
MPAFRITNVTNKATNARGHFLDLGQENGGKHLRVGGQAVLNASSYDTLPSCIHNWADKHWIRVVNLDKDGEHVGGLPTDGELTPSQINPVREMQGADFGDDEPELADAHEAKLPATEGTAPILQTHKQQSAPNNTKVTHAAAEERTSTDISPIPGDRPVNVDDTAQFTVKAGRSTQPGSVVKTGPAKK